jgi:oligopeptide/dipeptide ABC transporter ATP-binding protein
VEDLTVEFESDQGRARAVEGVSFTVSAGEVVGLVGESGCGKSATALALLGLLPRGVGRAAATAVRFEGQDLLQLSERRLRDLRGRRLAIIFQEPMTALNPVLTVGEQVAEVLRRHAGLGRREAWQRAETLLAEVGIPAPCRRARDYPHQLSGGMRQRVMIAMAVACEPRLLIADEPTTALDVTVQAQLLGLLRRLTERAGLSILLITHDLGVVAQTCDRLLVMYAGRIVEQGPVRPLLSAPRHPYTRGLLDSVPRPHAPRSRLAEIPGSVPPIGQRPAGCTFSDRCHRAQPHCRKTEPGLDPPGGEHQVRCYFPHRPDDEP